MSYAEIRVYRDGVLDGEAVCDATSGSGRLDKWIDAEPKIRELVEELMRQGQATIFWRDRSDIFGSIEHNRFAPMDFRTA